MSFSSPEAMILLDKKNQESGRLAGTNLLNMHRVLFNL